jgi:predicted alpha/beta-hydrolase family hydrolase
VLAHGAGAGQTSPFMVRFARGMALRGISTATFDFPYVAARRKVPDRAPVLEQSWREALDAAKAELAGLPIVIGGKSMGGRMASHIAAQGSGGIEGLVFLGYPLHPPGKPEQRRDAHLPSIAERMLFVQGARDPFGTAAEIAALLPSLQHAELHAVEDGDHSFKVPARRGDVLEGIMDTVAAWILAGR